MAEEIHVGDTGTKFLLHFRDKGEIVPLAGYEQLKAIFEKPDGTVVVKTATLETDGSDGDAKYITLANDLDDDGNWELQGYVKIGGGEWHSNILKFKVFSNLN